MVGIEFGIGRSGGVSSLFFFVVVVVVVVVFFWFGGGGGEVGFVAVRLGQRGWFPGGTMVLLSGCLVTCFFPKECFCL